MFCTHKSKRLGGFEIHFDCLNTGLLSSGILHGFASASRSVDSGISELGVGLLY